MADRLRILSQLPLGLLKQVREAFPDAEITQVPERGEIPPGVAGEILLTQAWGSPNLGAVVARGVRWVHCYGTGVNAFPFAQLGGAQLTCSRGASAVAIAEWAMACLLACEKELPARWIHEPPERWNLAFLGGLAGRTVGILGFGGIGQALATRCLAFDTRVLALRRSAVPSPVPGVEMVRSFDALLAESDHLVLAAPATAATRHLLDREAFARMRRGAHLVNVARGELVDLDALRVALDDGVLRLASLDVVEPEPLPAGHWLYRHERVRLSAHISWSAPWALDGLIAPFVANLRRWQAGEPLEGIVDLAEGY